MKESPGIERILAIIGLTFSGIACLAAVLVVPEVRAVLNLGDEEPIVAVVATSHSATPLPTPPSTAELMAATETAASPEVTATVLLATPAARPTEVTAPAGGNTSDEKPALWLRLAASLVRLLREPLGRFFLESAFYSILIVVIPGAVLGIGAWVVMRFPPITDVIEILELLLVPFYVVAIFWTLFWLVFFIIRVLLDTTLAILEWL